MIRKLNISEEIDWVTVGLYLALVLFGWLNIFASCYNEKFKSIFDIKQNYGDQLLWIVVSIILIIALFAIDYRFYHYFAYLIFGISILSLIAVLGIGVTVNNSRSWIKIFGFNLQPSEFVKVATALAIARFLSGYNVKMWTLRSIIILGVILGIPMAMIVLQPDWGTALVFSCFILLFYREGMPGWILAFSLFIAILFLMTLLLPKTAVIVILISIAVVSIGFLNRKANQSVYAALIFTGIFFIVRFFKHFLPFSNDSYNLIVVTLALSSAIYLIIAVSKKVRHITMILLFLYGFIAFTYSVDYVFHNILKLHQQTRVNILLGKENDVKSVGYNLNQSKIAIGSGGFFGKGFLKGTQTKLDFVPEQSTDFIFCTVGEEWGFLGTFILLILFTALLIRVVFLAERQRSQFARIFGYAVASILFFHVVINIAMTIGLFPVIGIPLPFFSYGGSSLLAFTLLLFILVRLDSVRKIYVR